MSEEAQSRRARQFVMLLLLRARGKVRASELAAALGVSSRTVARDCVELEQFGIPVVADRGATGGLRLHPSVPGELLRFFEHPREAPAGPPSGAHSASTDATSHLVQESLRLAVRGFVERMDARYRGDVDATLASLDNSTPTSDTSDTSVNPEVLLALRRALWQGRRVRLVYPTRGRPHVREVDPLVLVVREHIWYLAGYCHWRSDVRTFVVSRITAVEPLERAATEPQQVHLAVTPLAVTDLDTR
jgi:predicted DNA-binding transcriptional regulator YafY